MPAALTKKFTLNDLRNARGDGTKVPMLTCYDYTSARLMHEAGVPALLVGDSAANVVLGHPTTLPVSLRFMIELTAAVRRGAPMSFLVGDKWIDAPKGSFVLVPGGTTHDFENRGAVRAGALNFSAPGTFEEDMPAIAEWFKQHPPGDAGRS